MRAARYGLNIADVQSVVSAAIGGENIGETVEGLQRFPINVRYPREMRDSVEKLRDLPVAHRARRADPLGDVAAIAISDGPPMLQERERAAVGLGLRRHARPRPALGGARHAARGGARRCKLPPGYSISWSGQFEYLERATAKLKVVVPCDAARSSSCCSISPSGASTRRCSSWRRCRSRWSAASGCSSCSAINMSVASAVGFIALAGVAAEFGVVMLLYLKHAWEARLARRTAADDERPARRDPRRRGAARAARRR